MQGVPSEDDDPARGGGHAGHHVELQEVQRLVHGAIPGPLEAVKREENNRIYIYNIMLLFSTSNIEVD